MKNENNQDYFTIGLIYCLIIATAVIILNFLEIEKQKKEILEVKKIAIKIDKRLYIMEENVNSLNAELDKYVDFERLVYDLSK